MKVLIRKMNTYLTIVKKELKSFKSHVHNFGLRIAIIQFIDGILIPNKRPYYIKTIEKYVDHFFKDFIKNYESINIKPTFVNLDKFPIWICWWQGVDTMPEIVQMCYQRLQNIIPEYAKLHVITLKNYLDYVDMPDNIIDKFNHKIITMATMSDVLRMCLLSKYGGYWLDATVFFTGNIPIEYFQKQFYCQKMYDEEKNKREACKGRWCGFSMAGRNDNVLFHFMKDGFFKWWERYDDIPDYVLIDYMILIAYKNIPDVTRCINAVENNNEDIFEMYKHLNEPYTQELYNKLTQRNVMHKLTYKMKLEKWTKNNELTLYGYLLKEVFGDSYV